MRIFAIHVRDYNNAEVAYQPTLLIGQRDRRAMVRTEVTRPGIPAVSVDYRMHRTGNVRKLYDVAILGISLVKTYHITIAGELKRQGLDGVIAEINAKSPMRKADGILTNDVAPAG